MAETIIVSPTGEPVALPQPGGTQARWRCLSRRGMVFSELEGFDYTAIAPAARLQLPDHPYSELVVLISAGRAEALLDGRAHDVGPGDAILQPPGQGFTLTNTDVQDLEVVSVELIPPRHAERLPCRTPQIVEVPQAARP
jgi:mannose-6-phosphate isomerase-like protein (cupin superfamily)